MQHLRILTGRHAGSSLDLVSGHHVIGSTHDCDITITDWNFAPLRLAVGDDAVVVAEWDATSAGTEHRADGAGHAGRRQFQSFVPQRFENIVLCVGPADGAWPADVELLSRIFQAASQRAAGGAGWRWRDRKPAVVAGAVVLSLGTVTLAWTLLSGPRAEPVPTLAVARASMQRALDQLHVGSLQVQLDASSLQVTGMVGTSDQARQVRGVIAATRGPYPVSQRFSDAAGIEEIIRNTVGLPNAVVKHVGDGVFTYSAEAPDLHAAQLAIDRVQTDLSPVVRRIDATLDRTETADTNPILSRLTSDGLSVVQTRDGVKHLVVRTADDSPVTVSDALALPSSLSRPGSQPRALTPAH